MVVSWGGHSVGGRDMGVCVGRGASGQKIRTLKWRIPKGRRREGGGYYVLGKVAIIRDREPGLTLVLLGRSE